MPILDVSIKTHIGKPISAGKLRLIPLSQALVIQVPGRGGLVWNRPMVLGVRVPGVGVRSIQVYDYTRLAQAAILGAGLIGSFLIWLFLHKK